MEVKFLRNSITKIIIRKMMNGIHDSKIEKKSVNFFKDSKADSCSYVVINHGQAVAVLT